MRSFIGFGQQAYIGIPQPFPIKLAGNLQGRVIPLLFQWLSYGASTLTPNINVLVNIETAICKSFDQIRSVYIDNLGSPNPVYVYFPDTGYTISAKANSEGWYPALTNAKQIWVIGEGFLTGNIPQAAIILSNIPWQPAVNTELDQAVQLQLASPVITRGTSIYNTAVAVPAVADQYFLSGGLDITVINRTVPLWNTPYPSGFLYVNSLIIFSLAFAFAAGNGQVTVAIESTGVAGILAAPPIIASPALAAPGFTIFSGANVKLDATQTWRARVSSTSNMTGAIQLGTAFTQQ